MFGEALELRFQGSPIESERGKEFFEDILISEFGPLLLLGLRYGAIYKIIALDDDTIGEVEMTELPIGIGLQLIASDGPAVILNLLGALQLDDCVEMLTLIAQFSGHAFEPYLDVGPFASEGHRCVGCNLIDTDA